MKEGDLKQFYFSNYVQNYNSFGPLHVHHGGTRHFHRIWATEKRGRRKETRGKENAAKQWPLPVIWKTVHTRMFIFFVDLQISNLHTPNIHLFINLKHIQNFTNYIKKYLYIYEKKIAIQLRNPTIHLQRRLIKSFISKSQSHFLDCSHNNGSPRQNSGNS